ncbi:hypothetical protein MRX96_055750 [Rhipicephalus microplus]
MDAVVAVAISVLAVVFVSSLVALIVVCRHRYCSNKDHLSRQLQDSRPDVHLIHSQNEAADMELDDVRLHPDIEKILADEQWVDDATGLVPHCLAVLKTCHQLTERLRVGPRVDDVVRAMYPPLDARLLEARCTALMLSVVHLTLVMRSFCGQPSNPGWIDEYLAHAEGHLQVLREAGLAADTTSQQVPSAGDGSGQPQTATGNVSAWKPSVERHVLA